MQDEEALKKRIRELIDAGSEPRRRVDPWLLVVVLLVSNIITAIGH